MPIRQWLVSVTDTVYPTVPQVVIPFDADSVLFINLSGAPDDGSFLDQQDVQAAFDDTQDDDLLISKTGPGQSIAVNNRCHRIFLRLNEGDASSGSYVQVVATKWR